MPDKAQCILLFLKVPEKGRVKTRLAASLGEDAVLDLYKSFVLDIMDMLSRTGRRVVLYGHPADKLEDICSWLGPHLPCRPQTGEDLGRKMANAFADAFSAGWKQVVLIGADIPDLPPRIIHQAFSALEAGGAALGPSEDGGYYLIGFPVAAFLSHVFENISWGTGTVLSQTLAAFKEADMPVHLLEKWRDIDTIEDLGAILERHTSDSSAAPRTLAYLRAKGLKNFPKTAFH